jgi:hypothetical protein
LNYKFTRINEEKEMGGRKQETGKRLNPVKYASHFTGQEMEKGRTENGIRRKGEQGKGAIKYKV